MSFLKSIWKTNSRHKKLSDESSLQIPKDTENEHIQIVENENDIISFKLKYLGNTIVEKITGDSSTEAVKTILKVAKAGKKKLKRVSVSISLQGISVTGPDGTDIIKASIYSISNCAVDPTHRQVFSFVSTDDSETMECHAFLCPKRKTAETVTLSVAHAFTTAYEEWRTLQAAKDFQKAVKDSEKINQIEKIETVGHKINCINDSIPEVKLIEFEDDDPFLEDEAVDLAKDPCEPNGNSQWVCFEDDFVNEFPIAPMKSNLILA